jgi:hypothetical protein
MEPGFIHHRNYIIMNISKKIIKKVTSQNWICWLKMKHHQYSARITFQHIHDCKNEYFRDTSFLGHSIK